MRRARSACVIMLIIGIVFCIYGWIQSTSFSADSRAYEEIYMKRTVRSYSFFLVGGAFIFISYIIDRLIGEVKAENQRLLCRLSELEDKIKVLSRNKASKS